MLCYSKADRGILIGSLLQISKHMSEYWTTYQHSSSCRFLLRWSWRGERRLNLSLCSDEIRIVGKKLSGQSQAEPAASEFALSAGFDATSTDKCGLL
jgi:hypothetical protein